jgi:hypothetical protein
MSTDLAIARGQQVVSLLLSAMPFAERMLLYNVILAAWLMLPERLLLLRFQRTFDGYPSRRLSHPTGAPGSPKRTWAEQDTAKPFPLL